jgi:hypothetical protein
MDSRDRDILKHPVHSIAEQAANTNNVIDEAVDAGLAAVTPIRVRVRGVNEPGSPSIHV